MLFLCLLFAVLGLGLGYAARYLKVQGDPLVEQIDALLPQTQCGQCKYPGCRPYAQAVASGEADIKTYASRMQFPIIPCNLCGSQDHLQRQAVKNMLNEWHRKYPGRVESIFTAMQNVVPSHLADADMFDFQSLGSDADGESELKVRSWLKDQS